MTGQSDVPDLGGGSEVGGPIVSKTRLDTKDCRVYIMKKKKNFYPSFNPYIPTPVHKDESEEDSSSLADSSDEREKPGPTQSSDEERDSKRMRTA